MNKALMLSAVCCLLAFAVLVATLSAGGSSRQDAMRSAPSGALRSLEASASSSRAGSASDIAADPGRPAISREEADALLAALTDEYLAPWRQWENSPHRLLSRVAPKPIPTIYAKTEVAPGDAAPRGGMLVATVQVVSGAKTDTTPCVVDRFTGQVRLFAEGRWLTENEWLASAPLPPGVPRERVWRSH